MITRERLNQRSDLFNDMVRQLGEHLGMNSIGNRYKTGKRRFVKLGKCGTVLGESEYLFIDPIQVYGYIFIKVNTEADSVRYWI